MYAEQLDLKLKTLEKQIKQLTDAMKVLERNCINLQKLVSTQQTTISRLRHKQDNELVHIKNQLANVTNMLKLRN